MWEIPAPTVSDRQKQLAEQERLCSIAGELIATLEMAPQYHAVWIRSDVDENGEFVNTIRAAIHPASEKQPTLPAEFQGVPVTQVPWPSE